MTSGEAGSIGLSVKELSHTFAERQVFAPVSFSLNPGQVGVVTGANGAGKSTLLRIVAGLLLPKSGSVVLTQNGQTLDAIERRELLGYVAPDLHFYRELTAAENLQFFAEMRGRTLTKEEMISALTQVGLRGRGRDFVRTYSSGMRQRLKYAWVLLHNAPILLLDEPTANLDAEGVETVKTLLAEHRARPNSLTLIATNETDELDWGDFTVTLRQDS